MPIHEHRLSASNISSILSAVIAELGDTEIWFRGQHNSAWPLMPSVFREYSGRRINEAWSLHEFQRRFPHLRVSTPTTTEWLMHMQHYGLPTRLLDWSTSFLVGLYFATTKDDDKDAALFAFDYRKVRYVEEPSMINSLERLVETNKEWEVYEQGWESVHQLLDFLEEDKSDCDCLETISSFKKEHVTEEAMHGIPDPVYNMVMKLFLSPLNEWQRIPTGSSIPIYPPHVNSRLIAQHGTFTLHGGKWTPPENTLKKEDWIKSVTIDEEHYWADIHKFIIPANAKEALRTELRHAGITHDRLFPEMAEVCKTIREASLS